MDTNKTIKEKKPSLMRKTDIYDNRDRPYDRQGSGVKRRGGTRVDFDERRRSVREGRGEGWGKSSSPRVGP